MCLEWLQKVGEEDWKVGFCPEVVRPFRPNSLKILKNSAQAVNENLRIQYA